MIKIANLEYEVIWVNPGDASPLTEDQDGHTDYRAGKLYVRRFPGNVARERATLQHEVIHAALDASGAQYWINALATDGKADPDHAEEIFVCMLATALAGVLDVGA